LSSSNPNLQNIPTEADPKYDIRQAFIVDKGNEMLAADYSQVELRLLADMSGDEELLRAFKNDEDVHVGAKRELEEELGITVPTEQLKEVAIITAHVSDADHDTVFTTHLFATNIGDQEVHPSDDLDDIVRFSRDQMQELITRYSTLQDTVITIDRDYTIGKASTASSPFSWKDYGTFYGKVHEIALQLTDA
jgi:8-oxo-dGTP pyrophosphatase MutT (NUDIX family)